MDTIITPSSRDSYVVAQRETRSTRKSVVRAGKLLVAATIAGALSFGDGADANAQSVATANPQTSLLLFVNQSAFDLPRAPEDIVSQLTSGTAQQKSTLAGRLGNPTLVRPLTSDRLSIGDRSALPSASPKRLLDQYVVLNFDSGTAADAALKMLKSDASIGFVRKTEQYYFSVTPTDPLFQYVAGATKTIDAQWGMRALNLEAAWDYVYGTAYLALLDNGITPDHEDLQWNYRAHFSSNFLNPSCYSSVDEVDRQCGPNFTYAGHGTHVAGTMVASHNNGGLGIAGACWSCSLMVGRIGGGGSIDDQAIIDGLNAFVTRGAQVVNMSFGNPNPHDCGNPYDAMCLAIAYAKAHEVTLVAASGNNKTNLQFPASHTDVIAVGGIQANGALWDQQVGMADSPARIGAVTEIGTNFGTNQTVVAPARDVMSTFYKGMDWNVDVRCGTSPSFTSQFIDGGVAPGFTYTFNYARLYGICTGTSMAAPHVAGLIGVLRTANPLLGATAIRAKLTSFASRASNPDQNWGSGVPNAAASVQSILATNNRLTPLFVLYSASTDDYFMTIVPQMATAAIMHGMLPKGGLGAVDYYTYSWLGTTVSNYGSFPTDAFPMPKPPLTTDNVVPRARLRVFTTPRDASGTVLNHVFRYSYADTTPGSNIVRHVYAIGAADRVNINSTVWKYDGLEGYIYPPNISRPAGTYPIYRWVKPATATYILTPDVDQSFWASKGFQSDGTGILGYAYLN